MDGEHRLIELPLRLGPLRADGHDMFRSGIRWLIQPGQYEHAARMLTEMGKLLGGWKKSIATPG